MNISEYIDGLTGMLQSFGYISRHRLWKYCILPAVLSLIGAYFIYGFFTDQASGINDWLVSKYPWEWGSEAVSTIGTGLSKVISFIASLFLFKYLVLIISSPFMSLLSEKVEEIEFGKTDTHWSLSSLFKDLIRGIRISLRNIIKELFYVVLLLILGLIPVIGPISVILTFLVQAYYAGFGNIDFLLERHLSVSESTRFVKQHKAYAAGLGTGFLLLTMTGIGVLVAAPLATVAATRELAVELD